MQENQEFARPPKEDEFGQFNKEKLIGWRYDSLLAERKKIEKQLEKYNSLLYHVVFFSSKVPDDKILDIRDSWLRQVRDETSFLEPLDDLGIEIFKDDLTKQPGFPEDLVSITFFSKKVRDKNIVSNSKSEGFASPIKYLNKHQVEIASAEAPLNLQLGIFLMESRLTSDVSTLVHELIHTRLHLENVKVDRHLNEALAYFSGIIQGDFSITKIAESLSDSNGLYKFNKDLSIKALLTIVALYSLGKSGQEIIDLISKSNYDEDNDNFGLISDVLYELEKKHDLDEEDVQALYDIYKLHAKNQRLKARLLLFKTIDNFFSKKELREISNKSSRGIISWPYYKDEKKLFLAKNLRQNIVVLANQEYPYDPENKRTGIIFGYFPKEDEQGLGYSIGRLENSGDETEITLAKNENEIEKYLKDLKQVAQYVAPESKNFLVIYQVLNVMSVNNLVKKIVKTIITKDEYQEILKDVSVKIINEQLDVINEKFKTTVLAFERFEASRSGQLLFYKGLGIRELEDLVKFLEYLYVLESQLTLMGNKLEDYGQDFAKKIISLKKEIENFILSFNGWPLEKEKISKILEIFEKRVKELPESDIRKKLIAIADLFKDRAA